MSSLSKMGPRPPSPPISRPDTAATRTDTADPAAAPAPAQRPAGADPAQGQAPPAASSFTNVAASQPKSAGFAALDQNLIRQAQSAAPASADQPQLAPPAGPPRSQAAASTAPAGPAAPSEPALQSSGPATVQQLQAKAAAAGLSEAETNRMRQELQSLGPEDRAAKSAFYDQILSSPNARRAMNTYNELSQKAAASPEAASRLSSDLIEGLTLGVAQPRSSTAEGQEGLLSQATALRAAEAILKLPEAQVAQMNELLGKAAQGPDGQPRPGADALTEQLLVLKGLGARLERLGGPDGATAMGEVAQFADAIRGTGKTDLVRQTTAIDIDDTDRNQDGDTRNDGIRQRFTSSCVPTSVQIAKAEADPVSAFNYNRGDVNALDPTDPVAREQQAWLENGNPPANAISRQDAAKALETTNRLVSEPMIEYAQKNGVSLEELTNLDSYMRGAASPDEAAALATIQKLRDAAARPGAEAPPSTIPDSNEVRQAREISTRAKESVGTVLDGVLNANAAQFTGVQYQSHSLRDGEPGAHMNAIAARLERGEDVPFRVQFHTGAGHALIFTDVRGQEPDRSFLVSDPMTGRTLWASEQSVKDGTFHNRKPTDNPPGLGEKPARISHWYGAHEPSLTPAPAAPPPPGQTAPAPPTAPPAQTAPEPPAAPPPGQTAPEPAAPETPAPRPKMPSPRSPEFEPWLNQIKAFVEEQTDIFKRLFGNS